MKLLYEVINYQNGKIILEIKGLRLRVMVFNATFNTISVILWRPVLLVEQTGENYWPAASQWQTLSHNVVSNTPRLSRIQTHNDSGDRYRLHR